MYLAHFDLDERPFAITPDPRFVFLTPRHREALAHLLYGLGEGGGFVQLTGEVGTGKTTICRTLLRQLPDNVDVALIFNPQLTVIELLRSVCEELHITLPDTALSAKALMDRLYAYLIDANARGRRTVLILDEAQNLSPELLEEVRLLTNLETDDSKLLQVFLIGQPELRARLAREDLRQLAQRITARYHLGPLTREETRGYVVHRLSVAGARRELFTGAALRTVHRLSAGIPRRINILCDRALLGGYASDAHTIDPPIVRRAQAELDGRHPRPSGAVTRYLGPALGVAVLVAATGLALRSDLPRGVVDWAAALQQRPGQAAVPAKREPPLPVADLSLRADTRARAGKLAEGTTPETGAPETRGQAASAPQALTGTPTTKRPTRADAVPVPEPQDTHAMPSGRVSATAGAGATSAPPAAPREPTLEERLTAMDGNGRREATLALARLWHPPALPADGALCEWAPTEGLACDESPGDWPQVRALGLPMVLELEAGNGGRAHVLLRGLDAQSASIEVAGQVHQVNLDEVNRLWSGDSLLLWRPPLQERGFLRLGSRGPGVRWLRERLAAADGTPSPPVPGDAFDEELVERVKSFQRRNGLYVDGIVGPQTLLFLSRILPDADSPSLASTGEPDAIPSAPAVTPTVAMQGR